MKKFYLFTIVSIALLITSCKGDKQNSAQIKHAPSQAMPTGANLQDWERTKNPALGHPTPEKLIPILEKVNNYSSQVKKVPGQIGFPWTERGPYDTGGRTRAIMFDPNDANAKKVWAGGVTGGLWFNNDITNASSSWQKVDDFWTNLTVTCMAYDPNNTNVFYVGTGESFAGDSRGAGIWKSTDGGQTWAQISSTSNFYYVNDIAVRDEGATSAVLAAVTNRYYEGTFPTGGSANVGLHRSTNGGNSWGQVLPNISGQSFPAAASDIEIDADNNVWVGSNVSPYGLTNRGGGLIYKSTNGTTFNVSYTSGVLNGSGRVELACAPSDENYVYAIIEQSGQVHEIVKTTNGGGSWNAVNEPADADNGIPNADMSRGQARYDLIAAVHPTDRNQVIVGGIDLFRTPDGGTNWEQVSKWSNNNNLASLNCALVHADQHQLVFRPGFPNQLVNGNDGGVYFCSDITTAQNNATFSVRNKNYNVSQFYANAISPGIGSNIHLAGSQDNGTRLFTSFGKAPASEITGGDGGFCFIDQNEADIFITSYVYNNYYYSLDGGTTVDVLLSKNSGSFINPSAYDNHLNILYSAESSTAINKTIIPASQGPLGSNSTISLGLGGITTAISVSPNSVASSTLYIGTSNGDLFKVTDADGGSGTPTLTNISGSSFPTATIIHVFVGSTDLELVAVFSNYGVSSIWHTTNGGASWTEKEGDLPDMPIRWFLQNPTPGNSNEAIVATELGVWHTTNFGAASPNWLPSTSGLANVRVDMLQMRDSDKQVAAATYGRGLFTSDAFSEQAPTALFSASPVYSGVNVPVVLQDQSAALPTSWAWTISPANYTLLEGTTLNSQHPKVAFTQAGTYTISLTATNSYGSSAALTKTNYINVNSTKAIPYTQDFDGFADAPDKGNDCFNADPLSEGWINLPNSQDNSDWLTDANGTASNNTGPSNDHTTGANGKYLYTEASGCFSGGTMVLYTPQFDLTSKSAENLVFYYHMYGSSMGMLSVYAISNGTRECIWSLSGDQDNQWNLAEIDITNYNGGFVGFEFEAKDIQNFTSDMAIDDFSITELLTPTLLWDGGAATSNWSDALNWSTDVLPTTVDKVVFDNTYVSGSYMVNLNANQEIYDLDINMGANAVSLSGANSLEVTHLINPISGTLNANGQLVLKATSELNYAQIAAGAGSILGDVINQWYINGASGYRHLASPVICNLQELVDDFNTINFTTNATGSIWVWNASTSNWSTPTGGSAASFNQGVSVFTGSSNGDNFSSLPLLIDATGNVVTGNQSQNLAYSSGAGNGIDFENGADGWNFVYNPYPSTVQWSLVEAGPSFPVELASTYYFWDANIGASGAYASYNPNTATSVNGATDFIAKGKAFWVQASSTPSASLSFTDAMRNATESPSLKTNATEVKNQIEIIAGLNSTQDKAVYAEFFGATEKFDPAYDHLKMTSGNGVSVFLNHTDFNMAFNSTSQYQYPLPFVVTSKKAGNVKLNVALGNNFNAEEPNYILDKTTGKIHDLQQGELDVYIDANKVYYFELLHFKTDANFSEEQKAFVYAVKGALRVQLGQENAFDKIEILDLAGRLIKSTSIPENSRTIDIDLQNKGTFIVKLSGGNGDVYVDRVVLLD